MSGGSQKSVIYIVRRITENEIYIVWRITEKCTLWSTLGNARKCVIYIRKSQKSVIYIREFQKSVIYISEQLKKVYSASGNQRKMWHTPGNVRNMWSTSGILGREFQKGVRKSQRNIIYIRKATHCIFSTSNIKRYKERVQSS